MGSARVAQRLVRKKIEKTLAAHPCGACSECCTVKAVAEIQKPEDTPCKHLGRHPPTMDRPSSSGCRIYAKRPQSCKDYFCAYRFGVLGDGEMLRPDKLGIVFDVVDRLPPGVSMMVSAREARPNAITEAMPILHQIVAQGMVVYLIEGEKRRFLGPEELVKRCIDFARRSLPLHVPRD